MRVCYVVPQFQLLFPSQQAFRSPRLSMFISVCLPSYLLFTKASLLNNIPLVSNSLCQSLQVSNVAACFFYRYGVAVLRLFLQQPEDIHFDSRQLISKYTLVSIVWLCSGVRGYSIVVTVALPCEGPHMTFMLPITTIPFLTSNRQQQWKYDYSTNESVGIRA